jgi:hypothetical protein
MSIEEIRARIADFEQCKREIPDAGAQQSCDAMLGHLDNELRAALTSGITVERLEQLCAAEREQRVAVLPCKVGDTVWAIVACEDIVKDCDDDYYTGTGAITCPFEKTCNDDECTDDHTGIVETDFHGAFIDEDGLEFWLSHVNCTFKPSDFGKTVFITREAAQAALDGKGAGE